MDLGIKGRRALVAGSSAGIGRACAERIAAEGAKVFLVARDETKLGRVIESIRASGGVADGTTADLATTAGVDRAFDAALEVMGGVDILVGNTGGPRHGVFNALSDEDWQNAVSLLLLSAVRMSRRSVPLMSATGWGRIVLIESTSVRSPIDGLMLSNSIRLAVVGFAKTLVNEIAGTGITVNVVAPGYTATERLGDLAAARANAEGIAIEAVYDRWKSDVPLRRLGDPGDIADAVAFLVSERASYVNGVVLPVDGGRTRVY